jgi:hypothetical protein
MHIYICISLDQYTFENIHVHTYACRGLAIDGSTDQIRARIMEDVRYVEKITQTAKRQAELKVPKKNFEVEIGSLGNSYL